MRLLEQDVDVEETDVEVDVEVEEKPPAPGEQAIAELIAAAFAYLPTDEEAEIIEDIEFQVCEECWYNVFECGEKYEEVKDYVDWE